MKAILHQSLKDVRQVRTLLVAWLAVVALRALLVAFPFDARVPGFAGSTLGLLYLVLGIAHLALLVVIAVMIVHADSTVGTTAFWLTRPVARVAMVASKALTAALALVVLPAVATAAAVAANGLPWQDVFRVAIMAALEHVAVVSAAVAVAAVTADLAAFALACIALLIAFIASLVVTRIAWPAAPFTMPAVQTGWLVGVGITTLTSLVVFAGQYLWRFRRTALVALVVLALGFPIHLHAWKVVLPFRDSRQPLEAGWFDPAQATLQLDEENVGQVLRWDAGERADRWVEAKLEAAAPRQDVVLTPVAVRARLAIAEGSNVALEQPAVPAREYFYGIPPLEAWMRARDAVQAAVKPSAFLPDPDRKLDDRHPLPLIRLDRDEWAKALGSGGTYRADVLVRAVAIQPLRAVPLRPGARGRAGDRRFEILDAACTPEGCKVVLRDVVAVFQPDTRRVSRVAYFLSNRRLGVALAPASFDDNVLGDWAYLPTSEHVAITHRTLRFSVSEGTNMAIDTSWLEDSVIVPLLARDLGVFTRPLVIEDFGSFLREAEARDDRAGAGGPAR